MIGRWGSRNSDRAASDHQARSLDLISATTLVAASMIGVGVYTTSGYTLAALGTPQRVIAAWIVGGLIAICGAIGYGSLASRFAESGGEYLFLKRTLHPVAGLMAGWVSLLFGFTGAIAIAAIGLETYLSPLLFDEPEHWHGRLAVVAVLLAAILHTIGVRAAARVQDMVVVFKFAMIAGFMGFACLSAGDWPGPNTADVAAAGQVESFDLMAFASQLVWISFSYAGFNAAIYVASEVTAAERTVPKALVVGTVLVTLIYVVLNAIFLYSAPAAEILDEQHIAQIAATSAMAIGGEPFAIFVRLVIVVSLLTSVSALVMTGPRVYAKMADDGFFPSWFSFSDRPPVKAIWFQAALAIAAILIASLQQLLGYLGLTLSVCSALTVAMLFLPKVRRSGEALPLYGVPAGIYVLATLTLAVLYALQDPWQAAATIITVAIGLLLYPKVRA